LKEVSAAVIIETGTVVLARRSPTEKFVRFWEFPGGKIEANETPQQCLERELMEELGVSSTAGDVFCESFFEYDHGKFKIIAIYTDLHSKEFTLSSHDKADWVQITELLNYKLLPADIPIAEKIIEQHKNKKS
jgi:8-oxo-dGTP diphosphatase